MNGLANSVACQVACGVTNPVENMNVFGLGIERGATRMPLAPRSQSCAQGDSLILQQALEKMSSAIGGKDSC